MFKIISLADFNGVKVSRKVDKELYMAKILKAIVFQISWEGKAGLTKLHFITGLGHFNSQVVAELLHLFTDGNSGSSSSV